MRRLYFGLLLLLCISCSKDNSLPEDHSSITCSIVATTPEFSETKVGGDYVVRLNWTAGEGMSVVDITTNTVLGGTLKAASSGTQTTFSGTLNGTVANGDKLLFLCPAIGNSSPEEFDSYEVDFSSQEGSNTGGVRFAVYSEGTASVSDNTMSVSTSQCSFTYLMSLFQLSFSSLPGSTKIESVSITKMPTKATLSISNGVVNVQPTNVGSIVLTPSSLSTNYYGDRSVYFTYPGCSANTDGVRMVVVNVAGVDYSAYFNNNAYNRGIHRRMIISAFSKTTVTEEAVSVKASMPQLEAVAGSGASAAVSESVPVRSWAVGDVASVVNLSTKEVLGGTLAVTAVDADGVATLSGNLGNLKGVTGGDELLVLYPALAEGSVAGVVGGSTADPADFTSVTYDLSEQGGESLAGTPYVLAGTMVVKNNLPDETVEMKYLTSAMGLSLNGILNTAPAPEASCIRPMDFGGEGFGGESGGWGDEPEAYDINVKGVTLETVPNKLVVSYSSVSGFATSYESGALKLDFTKDITKEDDDVKVFFAYPAPSSAVAFGATVDIDYKMEVDGDEQSFQTTRSSQGGSLQAAAGKYTETTISAF